MGEPGDGAILGWLAVLVIALSPHPARHHSPYTTDRASAVSVSRLVFHGRWRVAVCIARYESRWTLRARNGVNLGPWQVNVTAHPWASSYLLTHSWSYSARVAYRISSHGRDWSPWTTHRLCGV